MSNIEVIRNGLRKEIKELQKIKDPTIKQKLELRNLKRHLAMTKADNKPSVVYVWCEKEKAQISNLMACMFCPYGHMTECHYPYECDSEYCNHYPGEEE